MKLRDFLTTHAIRDWKSLTVLCCALLCLGAAKSVAVDWPPWPGLPVSQLHPAIQTNNTIIMASAKSSQLMAPRPKAAVVVRSLKLPAVVVVPPPTNTVTVCFTWDPVPGADSYVLGWTWNSAFVNFTNVSAPMVCISYPATNPPPFVAVSSVQGVIQGDFSPPITRTNYARINADAAPGVLGPWQPVSEVNFTRETANPAELYRLRIYKYSNWPFPPGLP